MQPDQKSPLSKPLSPQQHIIMQHLVDGFTLKEIAEKMSIKTSTIGKYLHRVRVKIGAKSLYQCIGILVLYGEIQVHNDKLGCFPQP